MHIQIKNLPADIGKDDVRELMGETVSIKEIQLATDKHSHGQIASVHVDMDREEVNAIVEDLNGKVWHDTALEVYAPLFGED